MINNPVLKVENLVKSYEKFTAVNGVSFSVQAGEILGLLGPNGAGKTTIIQMLLSTLKPTSGVIEYFGKNFFTHRSEILNQVAFASTYVKLPGDLTVIENLTFYGKLYGLSAKPLKERIEKFLKFFGMWELRDRYTLYLSAGETTRVMLAKAFLVDPKVLLLDEPTAALDPDIAEYVRQFVLDQQRERNVAILFTSHNMDEVTQVCNRVLVLQKGTIIADDTPENLAASIATAHLELAIPDIYLKRAFEYSQREGYEARITKHSLYVEIDEHAIADFLLKLAHAGIKYTHISIEKPTLADYFLSLVKSTREANSQKNGK